MRSNATEETTATSAVLRLLVRNHPGTMLHICGLFARRSFNLDGILCLPVGDATQSSILLLVRDDARLEQVVRQLAKLEDVLSVRREPSAGSTALTSADARP
jgi:acetolactate synthase-1/3 small subunit